MFTGSMVVPVLCVRLQVTGIKTEVQEVRDRECGKDMEVLRRSAHPCCVIDRMFSVSQMTKPQSLDCGVMDLAGMSVPMLVPFKG